MKLDQRDMVALLLPYEGEIQSHSARTHSYVIKFPHVYGAATFESDMTSPNYHLENDEPIAASVTLNYQVYNFHNPVIVTVTINPSWWADEQSVGT